MSGRRLVAVGLSLLMWAPVAVSGPSAADEREIRFAWFSARDVSVPPSSLSGTSMVYNGARQKVTLFGGRQCCNTLRDRTYEYEGSGRWIDRTPAVRPAPREDAAMAFDAERGVVVLFGGTGQSGVLGDTWLWDGYTWTEAQPSTVPPVRTNAASFFDETRGTVVLFGGWDGAPVGDMWEWNGTTWHPISPGAMPGPRQSHSIAYDSQRDRAVLFGGSNGVALYDTWEWDGTAWSQALLTSEPSARHGHKLVYDPGFEAVFLIGGSSGAGEVWSWDGTSWGPRLANSFGIQFTDHSAAYDATRGRTVVWSSFGDSTFELLREDFTGPEIDAELNPPANAHGWNNSDVALHWEVGDPETGATVSDGCEDVVVSGETPGSTHSCSAFNGWQQFSFELITIRLDATSPDDVRILTPHLSVIQRIHGRIAGEASDALSGVDTVALTYRLAGSTDVETVVEADALVCDEQRTSCRWLAPTPSIPGLYTVQASGLDRASNETVSESVTIVVV